MADVEAAYVAHLTARKDREMVRELEARGYDVGALLPQVQGRLDKTKVAMQRAVDALRAGEVG
jgi:hypothetical protein